VHWQHGRHLHTGHSRPGCITIVPAGERHCFELSGPCKLLNWLLNPTRIASLLEQEADFAGRGLDLQPLLAGCDPALWTLADAMVRELDHPGLGSRLCVESLELGLIVQLLRRCWPSTRATATSTGNLPAFKLRVAIDFIKANLANDISLASLASTVSMSSYHFSKLFKRSTGRSPHRFVLEQRVEKAKLLLEEGDLSIAQTALSTGFASQSHLTAVFHRLVGLTPAAYQKACG
jgi:AraC family transcriptional regulator